jgi:hypothetical protein
MVYEISITTPWNQEEIRAFTDLDTPYKIQCWLDGIGYNAVIETRSPRCVMRHRRAHCLEGALFAAACLEHLGYPPLVIDMKAENDDDHIIAIYKQDGCWGAVGKSNFTTLRYREPVYRSLRELAMSYFDFYFNTLGEKTLRAYSLPHDLNRFRHMEWQTTENDLENIGNYLDRVRHIPLINPQQVKNLALVGDYLLKSSLTGSNPAGLFVPDPKK